jgi:YD repeat-containing protein
VRLVEGFSLQCEGDRSICALASHVPVICADTSERRQMLVRLPQRAVAPRGTVHGASDSLRYARQLGVALFLMCLGFASEPIRAAKVTYTYDDAGRLKAEVYDDGASVTYTLDPAGNRQNVTTTAQTPVLAPSNFAVAPASATALTLSWSTPTGGNGNYTYSIYNSPSGTLVKSATTSPTTVSGLTASTNYAYTISAIDSDGNTSPQSTVASSATYANPLISSFTAATVSSVAIALNWTVSDSGGPGGLTYSVTRNGTTVPGCTASPCTDSGAAPGTYNTYILTADDSKNDPSTATASAWTTPSAPGTPTFSSATATTATVNWGAASGTVTSYSYNLNSSGWISTGTTLSAALTGLSPGSNNTVQVMAVNAGGNSAVSSGSFWTLPSAPGTPTFSSATATTATVNWGAASGTVTSYSYNLNSSGWISTGTTLSVALTGLSPGSNNTVQVLATNAGGNGLASSASFTTLPLPPSAPGAPSFTSITTTTATVSWTAASGTVASYSYSVNSGAWTNVGTALSANLTSLTGGTTYTVQVLATNPGGNGPASSASFTTLPPPPSAPGAPSFTSITTTTATVSWTAASGTVASYSYSVNSGAWTNVGTALSANLTSLTGGTTYTVQVLATNPGGNGPASSASFTTLPPPPSAPGAPSFTSITTTTATVSWTAASGTVASYSYSVNSGAWTNVGTALSANLTSLTGGTTYTVQVLATNPGGNGPASSASFTTLPPPPSAPGAPSFTNITPTTATASWTAASGTVASYSYRVNSGAWTNVGTALSANLSGLTAGTSYTVQVLATNAGGNGPVSSGSFTTNSTFTDTPSMTQGTNQATETGFNTLGADPIGSMSPAATTNGHTYVQFDDHFTATTGAYTQTTFLVSGFTADPGIGWLSSAACNGTTRTGASATYSYVATTGTAKWSWTTGRMFGDGTVPCTIVHK